MSKPKNERVQPIAIVDEPNIIDVVEAPAIEPEYQHEHQPEAQIEDSKNNRTYAWIDRAGFVVKEMSRELGKTGRMKIANEMGITERSLRRDITNIAEMLEENDQYLSDLVRSGTQALPHSTIDVSVEVPAPQYDKGDIVLFEYGENGNIDVHTCINNFLPENYKDAQNAISLISLGSMIVNGFSQEDFLMYLKDCGVEGDDIVSAFGIQDSNGYSILKLKLSNGENLVQVQSILESLRRYINYVTGGNFVIIDTEYATQLSINSASAQQKVDELNKELDILNKNNMRLLAWLTITAILGVMSIGSVVLGYFSSYHF